MYEKFLKKYEKRQGVVDVVTADLEASQVSSMQYHIEVKSLRSKLETATKQLNMITETNAATRAKDQTLEVDNKQLGIEVLTNQTHLQEMNVDRHKMMTKLYNLTNLSGDLEEQRDNALMAVDQYKVAISKSEIALGDYKSKAVEREDHLNKTVIKLKSTQDELLRDILFKTGNLQSTEIALKNMSEILMNKEIELTTLQESMAIMVERLAKSAAQHTALDIQLTNLYRELSMEKSLREKAEDQKLEAELGQVNAEQITETLVRTIASLRKQLVEERVQIEAKQELYFITIQMEKERDMMAAEEVISKYGKMKEDAEAAERMRSQNQEKLDEFDTVSEKVKL